ncbi:MAG TPA: hypothetical protein VGP44_10715 [Gemmatimonadales bacterium]|nr:hypothetical protein [Gemmatimonadales bacterium]
MVRFGDAPTARYVADEVGASPAAIADSFERLARAQVLVLDPATHRHLSRVCDPPPVRTTGRELSSGSGVVHFRHPRDIMVG